VPRKARLAALAFGFVVVLACASSRGGRPLSDTLPAGLPSAAVRADWERIEGDYETPTEHVRYALFVDPEMPLLFRITQYRVTARKPAGGRKGATDSAEIVIWNATPRLRVPLLCFTEEPAAGERPRGGPATWRDVDPATPEFRASMNRALQIYGRVQRAGKAGPPVG
jgi:hypothetical protein